MQTILTQLITASLSRQRKLHFLQPSSEVHFFLVTFSYQWKIHKRRKTWLIDVCFTYLWICTKINLYPFKQIVLNRASFPHLEPSCSQGWPKQFIVAFSISNNDINTQMTQSKPVLQAVTFQAFSLKRTWYHTQKARYLSNPSGKSIEINWPGRVDLQASCNYWPNLVFVWSDNKIWYPLTTRVFSLFLVLNNYMYLCDLFKKS